MPKKNSGPFNRPGALSMSATKAGTVSRDRNNREYHAMRRHGYNVSHALICGFKPKLNSRQCSRGHPAPPGTGKPDLPAAPHQHRNWGSFRTNPFGIRQLLRTRQMCHQTFIQSVISPPVAERSSSRGRQAFVGGLSVRPGGAQPHNREK